VKKEHYGVKAMSILWRIATTVCLVIIILQFDDIQKRLINIEGTLESGSFAQRATPQARTTKTTVSTNLGLSKNRTWLHPDAPNMLLNKPYFTAAPNANYNTEIIVRENLEPKSYNRMISSDAILRLYGEHLQCYFARLDMDDPTQLIGDAAERLEITEDGTLYTIYLKKNIKWHKPAVDFSNPEYQWLNRDHYVTAHDFKFTLDTLFNPQVESSSLRNYFEDIESYHAIDEHTFQIKWKKHLSMHMHSLAYDIQLLPEFLYAYNEDGIRIDKGRFGLQFNNHWYNDRMIGCGPYRFAEHKVNQYVVLERNDDYVGPRPVPKRIIFKIIKDENLAYLQLAAGELDFIQRLKETIYRDDILVKKSNSPFQDGRLTYQAYPRPVYYYMGWNNNHPIFKDPNVRRAMTHAFDRNAALKNVLSDLGDITISPVLPSDKYYATDIQPYAFNLDKSRQILADAGWKDINNDGILEKDIDGKRIKFEFNFIHANHPIYKTMYAMFKENLIKIGIHMTTQTLDWAVFQKRLHDKEFDAFHGVWGMDPYLDFKQIWHSEQAYAPGSSNYISFQNSQADELIEALRNTSDQEKRRQIAHDFQVLMHDLQPYTFLFSRDGIMGINAHTSGVKIASFNPQYMYYTVSK